VILLTEWYIDARSDRQDEYVECLLRNAANEHVEEIRLFGRPSALSKAPRHPKIVLVKQRTRITFARYFAYAAESLPDKICGIANADIYFDNSLALARQIDFEQRMLCLTRWDVQPDGSSKLILDNNGWDVWIWKSPLLMYEANFFQGKMHCDTRLLYLFREKSLKVRNPTRSIRTHHLHLSAVRNYKKSEGVPGELYKFLLPTSLSEMAP